MKIVYENEDVALIPNVISFRRKHINYNDPKRFKSKMIYNSTSQSIIIASAKKKKKKKEGGNKLCFGTACLSDCVCDS